MIQTATCIGDQWRVILTSDTSDRHYVVCLSVAPTDSAVDVASCTCAGARYRPGRACKHVRRARAMIRRRHRDALDLVAELVEGAKLAKWSRVDFVAALNKQQNIYRDTYAAAQAVERELATWGIVRE
jgi:hypothetical protein